MKGNADVTGFLRTKMRFSLLRSVLIAIRGERGKPSSREPHLGLVLDSTSYPRNKVMTAKTVDHPRQKKANSIYILLINKIIYYYIFNNKRMNSSRHQSVRPFLQLCTWIFNTVPWGNTMTRNSKIQKWESHQDEWCAGIIRPVPTSAFGVFQLR